MKKIAFFSIPAHGHTNPMLPVATEMVRRGNMVRFYSFNEFEEKINKTGAEFISCDKFLPELTEKQTENMKKISTTEMTIQDIRITLNMDSFLDNEFKTFKPDVVYTDSVCFWGKLNAWKHNVPMVVSTSTFAFNQMSSKYMQNSPKEIADMVFGLPKISKELKTLKPFGYHVKNPLSLVQNDNNTDTIVYTSKRFQPYSESFSNHYEFIGPSVFPETVPNKSKEKPLVYISMGTIINECSDFYKKCIDALKNMNTYVIISCGKSTDIGQFGELPDNIKIYPYVNQLDVLSKADVFITHCGMNSVSESLYMATPMVLYPQTSEQKAVAKRVIEIGSGIMLKNNSAEEIRASVEKVLNDKTYSKSAEECSKDFRSCCGASGAVDFIENAPHSSEGIDVISELNKFNGTIQLIYWLVAFMLMLLFGLLIDRKYIWIIGLSAGILSTPIVNLLKSKKYNLIIKNKT